MMPTLFLLNVREFAPAIRACRARGLRVQEKAGYAIVIGTDEITLTRADTGLAEAIWYGLLTAGYEGRVAEFTGTKLRLVN